MNAPGCRVWCGVWSGSTPDLASGLKEEMINQVAVEFAIRDFGMIKIQSFDLHNVKSIFF